MKFKEIKKLFRGYKQFRKNYFSIDESIYHKLYTKGQEPKVLVVACSDSRVDPAIVLNCKPGDLFVIRNVANLIPPYEQDDHYHGTSAALEFGVCGLGVEHIILMGHTQCGGIRALIKDSEKISNKKSFIQKWMEIATPARLRVIKESPTSSLDEQVEICEQYALIDSLKNLMTFPWISEKVNEKKLNLHGWYFDLSNGQLHIYDHEKNSFVTVEQ